MPGKHHFHDTSLNKNANSQNTHSGNPNLPDTDRPPKDTIKSADSTDTTVQAADISVNAMQGARTLNKTNQIAASRSNDHLNPDMNPLESRINKYMAETGYCSRREADRLIQAGCVTIDDTIAQIGSKVQPGQIVRVKGQPILPDDDRVYLLLYKPIGITCTTDTRRRDNIIDYLQYPRRIFPVGRLDRDSEGLIILTNDGDIVNKILRAGYRHEKEYRVKVDRPLTDDFIRAMALGVPILDTITLPCTIIRESARTFRIILTQGLNRQIRRMCEYLGYQVVRLTRIRIMHLAIGNLRPGEWRYLTHKEIAELRRLISLAVSQPAGTDLGAPVEDWPDTWPGDSDEA